MLKTKNTQPASPAQSAPLQQPAQLPVQLPFGLSLPMQSNPAQINTAQALHNLLPAGFNSGLNLDVFKFPLTPDQSSTKRSRDCTESSSSATTSETDAGSVDSSESAPKRIKRVRSQTLNAQQAKEIYKLRPSELPPGVGTVGHTADLAAKYSVATNTIRDIWNRRSWAKATLPYWTPKEVQDYRDTYIHTGISL
eukprot:2799470-Rhodomonas_salina.1